MHIILPAPAKLNLFLHITARRPDGYHELQSLMQYVDWCDSLSFERADHSDEIVVEVKNADIDPQDNLVYRAACLLKNTYHVAYGVTITLVKNLPIGAGLGGGSSDAATTLLALNQLWGLDLSLAVLSQLGKNLGSDVPFFVQGSSAWAEGVGDQLTPIALPERWYLLVVPECAISTATLYQHPQLTRNCLPITIEDYAAGLSRNVFEEIACTVYEPVKNAINWLSQFSQVRMTGTGCVVFAAFDTAEEAGTIAALAPTNVRCVVCKGLNQSPLYAALSSMNWGVAKR